MSELTTASIMDMWRKLKAECPGMCDETISPLLRRPDRFLGMPVYEAPPPPPKIQQRQVYLKDGTPLFSEKDLLELNQFLIERFGFREDIFKDRVYIVANQALGMSTLVMSPQMRHQIVNMTSY